MNKDPRVEGIASLILYNSGILVTKKKGTQLPSGSDSNSTSFKI